MSDNFDIEHEFVDFIPREMEEGKLYIALEFGTVNHRCYCGCGAEVVTPLSPAGWQLLYDGETVSLTPSIGSWSLPCRSHYWIRRNRVEWSYRMSEAEIAGVRRRDAADTRRHYGGGAAIPPASTANSELETAAPKPGLLGRMWKSFWG